MLCDGYVAFFLLSQNFDNPLNLGVTFIDTPAHLLQQATVLAGERLVPCNPPIVYEVLDVHLANAVASTVVRRDAGKRNDDPTQQDLMHLKSILTRALEMRDVRNPYSPLSEQHDY